MKAAAARIAKRLGVALDVSRPNGEASFMWDGRSIAAGPRRPESHLIHDLAHWRVATPKRRSLPEWGLGSSPEGYSKQVAPVLSKRVAQLEEEHASILGVFWEWQEGLDWWDTFKWHSWDLDGDDGVVARRLASLVQRRIVARKDALAFLAAVRDRIKK